MLTGIGEVFPFMRIHSLLEVLQPEFGYTEMNIIRRVGGE
ncbi:MAG: DUF1788 domain-containing protein [Lachnospiraceae bacterium]|nr:DUF1788 domain-containing protein [Lachnospiraceae bacterium]